MGIQTLYFWAKDEPTQGKILCIFQNVMLERLLQSGIRKFGLSTANLVVKQEKHFKTVDRPEHSVLTQ